MDALVAGSLYLSGILLVGAGVTARFVLPDARGSRLSRRLGWGAIVGAAVLVVGSIGDVLLTLHGVLGSVGVGIVTDYLTNTRHGQATLARLGLAAAVLALALPRPTRHVATDERPITGSRHVANGFFILTSAALLGTFSWTSHAAAMGGTPPLLADLVHFGAAAAWAGPILYLAIHPHWVEEQGALRSAFRRVSRIGLISVLVLFVTGGYAGLAHMQDPERFVASEYGRTLGAKVVVVLLITGIAAVNRWRLLPAFLRGARSEPLRNVVRIEAVLLVGVLLLTGVLTTSGLPHEPGASPSVSENLASFLRFLAGR